MTDLIYTRLLKRRKIKVKVKVLFNLTRLKYHLQSDKLLFPSQFQPKPREKEVRYSILTSFITQLTNVRHIVWLHVMTAILKISKQCKCS